MKRVLSALALGAVTLGSLAIAPASVSAAPGDKTETSIPSMIPSSPANLRAVRMVRLNRTGEFLVVGRDLTSGTSTWHMWQLKSDLTVDSTFGTNGVVDLGVAHNTGCGYPSSNECSRIDTIAFNETANTYLVVVMDIRRGTTETHTLQHYVTGDLKTGAIARTVVNRDEQGNNYTNRTTLDADFAALGVTAAPFGRSECASVYGATFNGVYPSYTRQMNFSLVMLPNGSFVSTFDCGYSGTIDANGEYVSTGSGTLKDYRFTHRTALKLGASGLEIDTTFGTNGRVGVDTSGTKCSFMSPPSSVVDTGITSMNSTKMYTITSTETTSRVTTLSSGLASNGWTAYDGCNTAGPSSTTTFTSTMFGMTPKGVLTQISTETSTDSPAWVSRWVIDPSGRWVGISRSYSNQTTTFTAIRVKDGQLDASFGTNGKKVLSVPSSVTVGSDTYSLNYSLSGIVTTLDEVFFVGFSSRQTYSNNNWSCGIAGTTITNDSAPFVFSSKTGDLVSTYGTSGLGSPATTLYDSADFCSTWAGTNFVDSKGQPAAIRTRGAVGSQAAGQFLYTWETIAGATGGGEGGTGTGGATNDTDGAPFKGEKPFVAGQTDDEEAGDEASATIAGRVDTKVYRTAPKKVRDNTALSLLNSKQARSTRLISTTPRVCSTLTTSVIVTGTGRCTVRVVDKKSGATIRTFSTRVVKTDQPAGTELSTNASIMFKQVSARLSKTATSQIKAMAETAKGAGRIVIVGHSASLYDNEISNKRISLNRAAAVKRALQKAGAKNPISIIAMGSRDPISTLKSEKYQAKNRRVEVFFFPAG